MSDETTQPDEPQDEVAEQATEQDAPKPALPSRARNPLARDSDFVARPGFRSPSNARSKAQKKKGKKKR